MNKNVGVFETSDAHTRSELMRQIQELSRIALDFGIYIKEHNADYLSVENLNLRPKIGIKACNVAPEFAYHENKIILNYLKEYARKDYDHILDYIYTQKKWQKWVSSEAVYDLAFLATLAFHYHAHDVQVFPMVQRLSFLLEKRGVILKEELQKSTWQILEKYTGAFGYE